MKSDPNPLAAVGQRSKVPSERDSVYPPAWLSCAFVVVVSHVSGVCEEGFLRRFTITLVAPAACIQFGGTVGKKLESASLPVAKHGITHYLHIWSRILETQLRRPCNLTAKMVVWWTSFALNGSENDQIEAHHEHHRSWFCSMLVMFSISNTSMNAVLSCN